jgi:hypothetical protein
MSTVDRWRGRAIPVSKSKPYRNLARRVAERRQADIHEVETELETAADRGMGQLWLASVLVITRVLQT